MNLLDDWVGKYTFGSVSSGLPVSHHTKKEEGGESTYRIWEDRGLSEHSFPRLPQERRWKPPSECACGWSILFMRLDRLAVAVVPHHGKVEFVQNRARCEPRTGDLLMRCVIPSSVVMHDPHFVSERWGLGIICRGGGNNQIE